MADEIIEMETVVVHSNEAHYLHYNPVSSVITDTEKTTMARIFCG